MTHRYAWATWLLCAWVLWLTSMGQYSEPSWAPETVQGSCVGCLLIGGEPI
jgi:hypothetical protein